MAIPQEAASDAVSLRVELEERSYDIIVGDGLLGDAGAYLRPLIEHDDVVIVTDDIVGPLHLAQLESALKDVGITPVTMVLPAGEATKDFAHIEDLTGRILNTRIERGSFIIALGGGVIGDITGFAAAILLRGLNYIQIPTTLLSQVDSAVGGKTGINTPHGKNLIGAFYQPRLVLSDIGVLETLPDRDFKAGYGEVVKYGLISDIDFFGWLEAEGAAIIRGDLHCRRHAVLTSCAAKAKIVSEDETERGRRALLNLGHTFGHALEVQAGYGDRLLHGEAVAIGSVLAFDLSVHLGLCPAADADRVRAHFSTIGLPTSIKDLSTNWSADDLVEHMLLDKKVVDAKPTFILAHGIGKAFICPEVDPAGVKIILNKSLEN